MGKQKLKEGPARAKAMKQGDPAKGKAEKAGPLTPEELAELDMAAAHPGYMDEKHPEHKGLREKLMAGYGRGYKRTRNPA